MGCGFLEFADRISEHLRWLMLRQPNDLRFEIVELTRLMNLVAGTEIYNFRSPRFLWESKYPFLGEVSGFEI